MEDWFKKTDEEIIERLRNVFPKDNFEFIGKFEQVPGKDFGFFKDVRSLSGVKKFYPTNLGQPDDDLTRPLEIYTKSTLKFNRTEQVELKQSKWYRFFSIPAPKKLRLLKENPFLLQVDFSKANRVSILKAYELINRIFEDIKNTPEGVAINYKQAIEAISLDINTEDTTFIFELLQNADDYPNKKNQVSISFEIKPPYLIIKHNGSKFEVNNAVAICGVNEGDKREDKEKIGFKGIGFKSIFKDANFAYLKSNGYSFRFDEMALREKGFNLPWQVTPISTRPIEYESLYNPEDNVNIIIKTREEEKLDDYIEIFEKHFKDERILLFLRNVKKLEFKSATENFTINNSTTNWTILNESITTIPQNITGDLNRKINNNDRRVPIKFNGIEKTEIGFGFKITDKTLEDLQDATIYTYLPTKLNLGFGFIINGNFIPDASRTSIHKDILWNEYLFEQAGALFIQQIIKLLNTGYDKQSVFNLLPDFKALLENITDEDKILFINNFKKGFDTEVVSAKFLPSNENGLIPLNEVLIDETGITNILGNAFAKLTGQLGILLDQAIGKTGFKKIKKLIKTFELGKTYEVEDLKSDLIKPKFQEWLKVPENNFKILSHLTTNDKLKELLQTESIVLTETGDLETAVSIYDSIPDEVTFIFDKQINKKLLELKNTHKVEIPLNTFDAIGFITEHISNPSNINAKLNNEKDLLSFWKFIHGNWDKIKDNQNIINTLKQLNVLCKPQETDEIYSTPVLGTYLSKEYNDDEDLESIIKTIQVPNISFISESYIDNVHTSKSWSKVFRKLGVISDLKEVINELISKLEDLPEENHFEAGKQIFKYWDLNKEKESALTTEQLELIREHLLLKCENATYQVAKKCVISDHYHSNDSIKSLLPEIVLSNQISAQYEPRSESVIPWKNFFNKLKCITLNDKQEILDYKINHYIAQQEAYEDDEIEEQLIVEHIKILKNISKLYKDRTTNNLKFNNIESIKLLSKEKKWLLPSEIHLPSIYKPKLDLEKDEEVAADYEYLNGLYQPQEIDKYFLLKIGIGNDFKIDKIDKILFGQLNSEDFKRYIRNKDLIKEKAKNLNQNEINQKVYIKDHFNLRYYELLEFEKYYFKFIYFLSKHNSFECITETSAVSINSRYLVYSINSFIVFILNNVRNFPTEVEDEKNIPINLYSLKFKNLISDKSLLPKIDLTNVIIDDKDTTLEAGIGIKQKLDFRRFNKVLIDSYDPLKVKDLEELEILNAFDGVISSNLELEGVMLLNQNEEWKPIEQLFVIDEDSDYKDIDSSVILHPYLHPISQSFDIRNLSDISYEIYISEEQFDKTDEIVSFFKQRAKYIAFKIDPTVTYAETEQVLIDEIEKYVFLEVDSIEKAFPNTQIDYKQELNFSEDENQLFYVNSWKYNLELLNWFITEVFNEKINIKFFQNVLSREEHVIRNILESIHGELPFDDEESDDPVEEVTNDAFLDEVKSFMYELEDTEWRDHIPDLENLLDDYINQPKEKRKIFNLIAKLKLAREENIHFDSSDFENFNYLVSEDKKFIVHSARGAFAYIHPSEILKMKNEGYKMALDFGTHTPIRIYDTHEKILTLNSNHLLLYQGDKSIEELVEFCEENAGANKHLLVIDQENSTIKNKDIFKLLNSPSDDYR